jgi:histidinol-phosphate phosphatase family protein
MIMQKHRKNFSDVKRGDWSLFLDRDGVLNEKVENGYVTQLAEFRILPGVPSAMHLLSKIFKRIIVVTNQRGVSRGLYTESTLEEIHEYLVDKISSEGGRIDKIFFCPHDYEENCDCRKPNPGMAIRARDVFPEIDFNKSFMIGDSISDIQMGERLGMVTVLLSVNKPSVESDFYFKDLLQFARFLCPA